MDRLTENVLGNVQLKACGNDFCKETCAEHDEEKSCNNCPIQKAFEKLAEYEDLEEQGKLLKLPCAVGDIVYVKMKFGGIAEAEVRDYTYFISCGFCIVVTSKSFDKQNIPFSEIGKTVFLTKPEAEAKLKG